MKKIRGNVVVWVKLANSPDNASAQPKTVPVSLRVEEPDAELTTELVPYAVDEIEGKLVIQYDENGIYSVDEDPQSADYTVTKIEWGSLALVG